MSIKTLTQHKLTWINIDQVNEESLKYLREHHHVHLLDLEDVESEQKIQKIDFYKDYIFLVFLSPRWQSQTATIIPQELDIFVGENYLITIQKNKSKKIKDLFYRCMNNTKIRSEWMGSSSGYLLYNIILELLETSRPILNKLGKDIASKENEIFFSAEPDTGLIMQMARLRRNVIGMYRILDPQRYVISTLQNANISFLGQHADIYIDNIKDILGEMCSVVETYKETIHGFHITVESLLNRKTNKIIGALTFISVIVLPFNVLSGIYGMNIIGLPFAQNPIWVWFMFAILLALTLVAILFMRRRRLF